MQSVWSGAGAIVTPCTRRPLALSSPSLSSHLSLPPIFPAPLPLDVVLHAQCLRRVLGAVDRGELNRLAFLIGQLVRRRLELGLGRLHRCGAGG